MQMKAISYRLYELALGLMGRRRSNRMFWEFLCSLFIGFITGFILSHTVSLILRRRQEAVCRLAISTGRHRTTSTEAEPLLQQDIPRERLVFIGVMTARKFLKTRADAIYKSWGSNVPGRLVFFVGTGEDYETSLPVVVLSDVEDDVYPPQRKSFEMLKYMSTQHRNDFNWFMRLDDDVYVNTKKLRSFLMSINSSKEIYMGHPGSGRSHEKGRLGLHGDKYYCMGGPGVVLSAPVLNKISRHFETCLNATVSTHEDTELGRCVEAVTGLSCTGANEFQDLFYQSYTDSSGVWTVGLKPEKLGAISYHPIKQPTYLFSLHIRLLSMFVREKVNHMHNLRQEMMFSGSVSLDIPDVKNCWLSPCDVDDGRVWACVKAYDVYSLYSEELKESVLHKGRVFGYSEARHALGRFLKKEGVRRRHRLSPVTYQRLSAPKGLEHIVVTKDEKNNVFTFRILQKFDPLQIRKIPKLTQ